MAYWAALADMLGVGRGGDYRKLALEMLANERMTLGLRGRYP
jgi:hypothetical protein